MDRTARAATNRGIRLCLMAGWAVALFAAPVSAQVSQVSEYKARIWEVMPGTPIAGIPERYLDPHCGTNGGPPSIRLDSFADFAQCRAEPGTGLHEVWFTEDDELEYVARAYRAQWDMYGPNAVNVLYNHRMIYSLLIDDAGVVQGYRFVTDPRELPDSRIGADYVAEQMRGLYGWGRFTCENLPTTEFETPVEGRLTKEVCRATFDDGRHITIYRHYYYKRGQMAVDPLTGQATVNQFESSTRVEMIAASLAGTP